MDKMGRICHKAKKLLLASVNFFLGGVAGYQLIRIVNYRREAGDTPIQVFDYIFNGKPEATNKIEPTKN